MLCEVELDFEAIEVTGERGGGFFLPINARTFCSLAVARIFFQPSLVAKTELPKPKRAKVRPAAVIPVPPESSPPTAMLNRVAPITPPAAVSTTPATFILCTVLELPAFTALKDA